MNLKDYSFVALYVLLLIFILSFFTMFFFSDVISRNSVEIVKQYLINVALVDPSVADIIKAAKGMCTAKDAQGNPVVPDASSLPTNNVFAGSTAIYLVYGIGALSVASFVLHVYFRHKDKTALFTGNEILSLAFLLIPVGLEIVSYYFVYGRYKYYSNVYLIKLMKNMRLRADIKYLTQLWAVDAQKIEQSGTDAAGNCTSNCLPTADRINIMQLLNQSLKDYDKMLDVGDSSEWAKLEPAATWTKISKLPGKLGILLTIAAIALIARAGYELNMQNHTITIGILVGLLLYIVFIYLLKDYISSGKFKTTASLQYINRLFCQTDTDILSKLLHRNLIGNDTATEVNALQGTS